LDFEGCFGQSKHKPLGVPPCSTPSAMQFNSEKDFESHLRELIRKNILPLNSELIMLDSKKAVDILLCLNGKKPALYFLELKYAQQHHGRCGTGQSKGGGFQPEILRRKPVYFETNMRWILGIDSVDGYWFLPNSVVCNHLSGGSIGTKFNNIAKRLFAQVPSVSEEALIEGLKQWLEL